MKVFFSHPYRFLYWL